MNVFIVKVWTVKDINNAIINGHSGNMYSNLVYLIYPDLNK